MEEQEQFCWRCQKPIKRPELVEADGSCGRADCARSAEADRRKSGGHELAKALHGLEAKEERAIKAEAKRLNLDKDGYRKLRHHRWRERYMGDGAETDTREGAVEAPLDYSKAGEVAVALKKYLPGIFASCNIRSWIEVDPRDFEKIANSPRVPSITLPDGTIHMIIM